MAVLTLTMENLHLEFPFHTLGIPLLYVSVTQNTYKHFPPIIIFSNPTLLPIHLTSFIYFFERFKELVNGSDENAYISYVFFQSLFIFFSSNSPIMQQQREQYRNKFEAVDIVLSASRKNNSCNSVVVVGQGGVVLRVKVSRHWFSVNVSSVMFNSNHMTTLDAKGVVFVDGRICGIWVWYSLNMFWRCRSW